VFIIKAKQLTFVRARTAVCGADHAEHTNNKQHTIHAVSISVGCPVWNGTEMRKGFCWVNFMERDYLQDLGLDGRLLLKRILKSGKRGGGLD
jgi:hypothetical protein